MASIVVVGGGVAGLACAWRLQQRGFAVEVLEREPAAGGRLRAQPVEGCSLERGAATLRQADTAVRRLVTGLGLTPVPDAGSTVVLWDGRLHAVAPERPLRGAPPLSAAGRFGLARLAAKVAALPGDLHGPATAAPLERAHDAGAVRRIAGEEAWARWVELLLVEAGSPAALEGGDAFQLSLLARARAGLGRFGFEGGAARLSTALAAGLAVRTGCSVESIETGSGGVRVRYRARGRSHSVVADAAAVALPADRVAGVCPKLTPDERGFFAGARYLPALVLHLLLDERPGLRASRVLFPAGSGLDAVELRVEPVRTGARVRSRACRCACRPRRGPCCTASTPATRCSA